MAAAASNPSTPDIPKLLRFLTQDAKVPLSKAMSTVKPLQAASLASPGALATSNLETLNSIFSTPEDAKRVFNAAKRVAKRSALAPDGSSTAPASAKGRKRKYSPSGDAPTPRELEDSLSLPDPIFEVDLLCQTVLYTNRAPLLLAFAVVLLKHTMPSQPLSSRLSLAQGMVSTGAREKAVNIGLEKGKSAEEDGWGMGQAKVRVMSREIRVMKRWGYRVAADAAEGKGAGEDPVKQQGGFVGGDEQQTESKNESDEAKAKEDSTQDDDPALWALDLEALKKSNTSPLASVGSGQDVHGSGLPIYTPQSARAYILKSFASAQGEGGTGGSKSGKGRKGTEEKEANLGLLLGALELLFQSWAEALDHNELNRRAWSWYVAVRPDVEHGVAGWGGKGEVRLAQILDLRKPT